MSFFWTVSFNWFQKFSVFFTMDDDYGGISRAMRNRSVELYLFPDDCAWFKIAQDLVVCTCYLYCYTFS